MWDDIFGRRVGVKVMPVTPPTYPTTDIEGTTVDLAERIDSGYANAAQKMAGPGGPASPDAVAAVGATIDSFAEPAVAPAPLPAASGGGELGFHAVLSHLREHPAVLRALGLIVELRVPVAELDRVAVGAAAQVKVECAGLGELAVSPWTRFERSPGRFLPASTDTIVGGMADLTGAGRAGGDDRSSRWALTTVDVDGGAQRLAEAAATRAARSRADETEDLPALRSAGLVLLRRDRADSFDQRQRRGGENAGRNVAELELDADDLLLGYRIDIKDTGQPWRSLHQRRATYLVNGAPVRPEATEEGHIKAFAAVTTDGGRTLHTDEVVARWAGWSLAVDPPDLTGRRARGDRRRRADVPYDLDWSYRVPNGSLPQLRFGRAYRVRIRAADAAGGGLGLSDPVADAAASQLIDYARHEPIGPPHVAPPTPTLGESAVRIVIRSDPATGLDAEAFSAQFPAFPSSRQLPITPPVTTVQVAEQHGFLDGADRATWEVAQRAIDQRADRPGLPDPAAEGVVVHLHAGPDGPATASSDDRAWTGTWPTLEPKALHLGKSTVLGGEVATINWLEDDRTVQLLLRPAAEVTIELSSILPRRLARPLPDPPVAGVVPGQRGDGRAPSDGHAAPDAAARARRAQAVAHADGPVDAAPTRARRHRSHLRCRPRRGHGQRGQAGHRARRGRSGVTTQRSARPNA